MQFLKVGTDTTLSELGQLVGQRNVSSMLVQNQLSRSVNIGQQFYDVCKNIMATAPLVSWQDKQIILNKFVGDYNIFEEAALLGDSGWKVLKNLDAFPNAMRVPETIKLPDSSGILGGGGPVGRNTYNAAMAQLADPSRNNQIDPGIFNDYSAMLPAVPLGSGDNSTSSGSGADIFQWFHIPWGQVTLVDSISQDSVDFPVYPEELSDKRIANYSTMPDLLYQYEPWQVYDGSGPRSVVYSFDIHRQMWTGNEGDGKANELIRFCQAFLYPVYSGSAVNTPIATLYVSGSPLISGIITDVSVDWDGPISSIDNWYLHFKINLSFIEVATQALNHDVVRGLPLIG
jgi:hypothetical protein